MKYRGVIFIGLAIVAVSAVILIASQTSANGGGLKYKAVIFDADVCKSWTDPNIQSREIISDELEKLGLEVKYNHNYGGFLKSEYLEELGRWDVMFWHHFTHGGTSFIMSAWLPDGPECSYVYDYEMKAAMANRPPFRLAILHSCYAADGTLPSVFTHNFQKKSVVLAQSGNGSAFNAPLIEDFLRRCIDNPTKTVYEVATTGSIGGSPKVIFFGDREMLCYELFTPVIGDANQDGNINALDITKLELMIAGMIPRTYEADVNQDSKVNALDITALERLIAGVV